MLSHTAVDRDTTESSIYDLDHAPEPSVYSSMLHLRSSATAATSVPPPPPSLIGGGGSNNNSARYTRTTSLSPRPPSGSGRSGQRKTIVVGENPMIGSGTIHPTLSQSTVGSVTTRDSNPTLPLSGSLMNNVFNRRRLSSHSSIVQPSTTMYGQQYPLSSNPQSVSTITRSSPSIHTQRQRAYSTNFVPDHDHDNNNIINNNNNNAAQEFRTHSLAHVRSFPPPQLPLYATMGGLMVPLRDSPTKVSNILSMNQDAHSGDQENTTIEDVDISTMELVDKINDSNHESDGDNTGRVDDDDDDDDDGGDAFDDQVFVNEDEAENSSKRYRTDTGMSDVSNISMQQQQDSDPTGISLSTTNNVFDSPSIKPSSNAYTTPGAPTTFMNSSSTNNIDINKRLQLLNQNGSSGMVSTPTIHTPQPLDDNPVSDDDIDNMQRIHLFGCLPLPYYFSNKCHRIDWDRVPTFVAIWAPCFICFRMEYSTYRAVLYRLNVLCVCMALVQIAASTFIMVVLYSSTLVDRNVRFETEEEREAQSTGRFEVLTNVWNLNGSLLLLGVVALIVLLFVVTSVRAFQNVDLAIAIRYLWLTLWIIPLQTFWGVSLFDHFHVSDVWIKFWWRDVTMAWFRHQFCIPNETANTKCTVPRYTDAQNETMWCQMHFNSTDCAMIRDNAQTRTSFFLHYFYQGSGVWTLLFVFLLFLIQLTLQSIITRPLVEKSYESNVPIWLLLPTAACTTCGILFGYSETSILNAHYASNLSWISRMFAVAGVLLAWFIRSYPILSTNRKHHKSIAIFIFMLASLLLTIGMGAIFISSIIEAIIFTNTPISNSIRGHVACSIDHIATCTLCDNDSEPNSPIPFEDQCPEWSQQDITSIIQSQAKAGATVAIIALCYAVGAFRYGLVVQKHVFNYKIAYV